MGWFQEPRPRLLLAALALNVFFAGLIGSALLSGHRGGPDHPPPLRRILREAGPEVRPLIDRAMAAREAEIQAAGRAARASGEALKAAMTAEVVDRGALAEAFEARRKSKDALGALMEGVFIEVLPALPHETRKKLAERRRPRPDDRKRAGEPSDGRQSGGR